MRRGAFKTTRGFTLLELVISIALLALLVGMVFGLVRYNVGLANLVVDKQAEVSERSAFFDLLGNQFAKLPGNARLELVAEDSGAQYLSDLTLQNVPLTFNWGGAERVAKAVQLSTVRRRDGFLDIVLRYFEDPILEETSEVGDESSSLQDAEPFAEVVLMEDVYIFEWRVLDGRTMEWSYDWDLQGRLPLQMELIFVQNPDDAETPMRHVFWITPKQNPEVMMRQLQQQGQAGQTGGGGGRGGADNDNDGGGGGGPGGGGQGGGGQRGPSVNIPNRGGGGGR